MSAGEVFPGLGWNFSHHIIAWINKVKVAVLN